MDYMEAWSEPTAFQFQQLRSTAVAFGRFLVLWAHSSLHLATRTTLLWRGRRAVSSLHSLLCLFAETLQWQLPVWNVLWRKSYCVFGKLSMSAQHSVLCRSGNINHSKIIWWSFQAMNKVMVKCNSKYSEPSQYKDKLPFGIVTINNWHCKMVERYHLQLMAYISLQSKSQLIIDVPLLWENMLRERCV